MLEKLFKLTAHQTTIFTEIIAGLTTFLAMAYILFINPAILSTTGMDKGSVFVATCLSAAFGSMLMGFMANYPIALAPGMGLNVFFTYTVVLNIGHPWQIALGAMFLSALIFFALSIFKVREWIITSIPLPLRSGITVGIGLFLAIIALQCSGIIINNPMTLVSLGDLTQIRPLFTMLGFIIIVVLEARHIPGAVLIGIFAITFLSIAIDISSFNGVVSMPPSIALTFMQLDIKNALNISLASTVFTFLFLEVFDNTGTFISVIRNPEMTDEQDNFPKMKKALVADSTAALFSALLGTSSTTSYIESAAGVSSGGRTGLTAIVTGVLFLLSTFFSPLISSVPAFATAPALLFVSVLMTSVVWEINWKDITVSAPVTVTIITMPLTYSISNGIAFGIITWTLIKLLAARYRDLNIVLILLFILSIIKLCWFNS